MVDLEVVLLVNRIPLTFQSPVKTEKLLFGLFRFGAKLLQLIHHVVVCGRTWFEQNQSPVDASLHLWMRVS